MTRASKASFQAALRAADEQLRAQGVPASVDHSLRHRLAGRAAGHHGRWVQLALVATAGVAVGALALLALNRSPTPVPAASQFTVEQASSDLRYRTVGSDEIELLTGSCELRAQELGLRAIAAAPLVLRRTPQGVRLVHGSARFVARHRTTDQPPLRVQVSYGTIEVLGTEFSVTQQDNSGRVLLHTGAIQFTHTDGARSTLAPGDSITWPPPQPEPSLPQPEPSSPQPEPSSPQPEPSFPHPEPSLPQPEPSSPQVTTASPTQPSLAPPAALTSSELVARLAKLRSKRQFHQAAAMLRQALQRDDLDAAAKEQLDYELGTMLTDQLDDDEACDHWSRHERSYPHGRYAEEVASAKQRLSCEDR